MSTRSARIPSYGLFGEGAAGGDSNLLHVEDIQARSRRYQWEIGAHTHHGLAQVLFVSSGPARVDVDDARSELVGPLAVIVPPATVHAFRFGPGTEGWVLTFAPAPLLERESAELRAALEGLLAAPRVDKLHWRGDLVTRLGGLFERLALEFRQPDSAGSPVPRWLARSLLWILSRELPGPEAAQAATRRHHQLFVRFRDLVEAHYAQHWPLERYARQLNLTAGRLNRLCRSQCGRGAFEIVQDRLALEARRRLIHVAAPVAQLAYELGFQDPAYFSRFFRRRTGVTPTQFRAGRQAAR